MYHSGNSCPHIIRAWPARFAVCCTVGETSRGALALAEERLRAGGALMLDNGAFSLFSKGVAMDVERAAKVLDVFERFAAIGGDLTCVAPDVIGDALSTVQLQHVFASRLRALAQKCRLIVPVQGMDVDGAAKGWRDSVHLIGTGIVAGIPSKRAAWTLDMVREFIALVGPTPLHFLGGSSKQRANLAAELGCEASSDSRYALMTSIGSKCPCEACRARGKTASACRKQIMIAQAAKAERRVAGTGAIYHEVGGQRRWPWALYPTSGGAA